jgi:hypothetical protein
VAAQTRSADELVITFNTDSTDHPVLPVLPGDEVLDGYLLILSYDSVLDP